MRRCACSVDGAGGEVDAANRVRYRIAADVDMPQATGPEDYPRKRNMARHRPPQKNVMDETFQTVHSKNNFPEKFGNEF